MLCCRSTSIAGALRQPGGRGGPRVSAALEQVAALVRRETGIVDQGPQLPSLAAALRRIDPGMDAAALPAASSGRRPSARLLDRLVDEVTVKETFFFRQRASWTRSTGGAARARARGRGRQRPRLGRRLRDGRGGIHAGDPRLRGVRPATPPVSILATDISGRRARARAPGALRPALGAQAGRRDAARALLRPRTGRARGRRRRCARWSSSGATTWSATLPPLGDGAVRPDRLPQRPDLLRRRDGRAGDRLARAGARAATAC